MKNVLIAITLSSAVAFSYAAPGTMMTQNNMNDMSTNMNALMMGPAPKTNNAGANMKANNQMMQKQKAPAQNIQLTQNQKTVSVNLTANATTGYQWFVQNYDHNLLTLSRYTYKPESTNRIGAGGTATFVFTVNPDFYDAPQTSSINFVYQQPWNPGENVSNNTVTLTSMASNNGSNANSQNGQSQQNNWLSLPSAMQTNS